MNEVLSVEEIKWLVIAFLQHPDRVGKGTREDEIIRLLEWAADLKTKALMNLEILEEIYLGNLVLDVRDGEVFMSKSPSPLTGESNGD
jgi:hypothetical protein